MSRRPDRFGARAQLPRSPRGTPYLLVDGAACRANIQIAAEFSASRSIALRPHFKAHKCVELLRRQVSAGGCSGVTCATGWEARVLAAAGFGDILVANEIVDPGDLQALGEAAQNATIGAAVDSLLHVQLLQETARSAGSTIGVLIDLDVGLHRCGIDPAGQELLGLAQAVMDAPSLRLDGLMGYEGHAALEPDSGKRRELVAAAAAHLLGARETLIASGFPCPVISGGSTGTYEVAADAGGWTEIQAGSYVLMDGAYSRLELPFGIALYCVGTLISRHGTRAVVNAGLKALSAEQGLPRADHPTVTVLGMSDEHARLSIESENPVEVGDPLVLIPSHVDPTVNLHDRLFVLEEDEIVDEWEVTRTPRVPADQVRADRIGTEQSPAGRIATRRPARNTV